MAFSKSDRQYVLITDAATSTADTPGGLRAIFTQVDKDSKLYAIWFASRQLKDHEKTTLFSYWKLRPLFGERTSLMSTFRENSSSVYGPQTFGKAGPPPQQDIEQAPVCPTGTRLCDPIKKGQT
jgi:hypothetical protein